MSETTELLSQISNAKHKTQNAERKILKISHAVFELATAIFVVFK